MLVLKVPVQVVLGWAAVRFPGLATGVQVCASAGSDTPSDKGTSAEVAISQNFRRFAPTLDRIARPPASPTNDSTYTRIGGALSQCQSRTRRLKKPVARRPPFTLILAYKRKS